jgi:tRNA(adenine34) deaminase
VTFEDREADDARWMGEALAEARRAALDAEAPVGAVVVLDGRIVGRGRNAPLGASDPTAHAEMLAIREAARALGAQRLTGGVLYVTVEPCAMCAGAALHARLGRVVYGAPNEKFGACGSRCDLLGATRWNHRVAVRGGVRAAEAAALLREFFGSKRKRGKADAG